MIKVIYIRGGAKIGDQRTIVTPRGAATGTVVRHCIDDYEPRTLCGGKVINPGEGYYEVELEE